MKTHKTKVVIAGSAKLQNNILRWKKYWDSRDNHVVIYFPVAISKKDFLKEYPAIHKKFFRSIHHADILFIANTKKNGIRGYIGAEVFAELVYGMMQKLLKKQRITIYLAEMPSPKVQSHEEIRLWLTLGWITLLADSQEK